MALLSVFEADKRGAFVALVDAGGLAVELRFVFGRSGSLGRPVAAAVGIDAPPSASILAAA